MDQRDIAVLLALMRVEGAGNAVGRRALTMSLLFGMSVSEIVVADPRELIPHLPDGSFDTVLNATRRLNDDAIECADRHVARVLEHGVRCFAYSDDEYPILLSRYLDEAAPALAWCAGNVGLLGDYGAGVVGTRTPSPTGQAIASDCARLFAQQGICVISGGADGVDTAAHRSVLDAGGTTVIVLPQGIRTYTFPDYVRDAIESNRCALISQFDPEMTWQTHAAVTRNATIAALSKLVCIVEPKRMGGTMRTAKHAREQDKPVFYFCGNEGAAFGTLLRQGGALPLVMEENRLDVAALRARWSAPAHDESKQRELF